MATPFIPSSQSVVDYLKTSGKDSSLGARRKLYNDLGLNKRLGDFVGSPSQNTNLLKQLQSQAQSSTSNIDFSGGGAPALTPGTGTPASTIVNDAQKPAFSVRSADVVGNLGLGGAQTSTPATTIINRAGFAQPATEAPATPPVTPSVVGAERTQALDYLKNLGFSSPDEGEIQGAVKDLATRGGQPQGQPQTGLGTTAETNRLLGGQYFDEQTGKQIREFTAKTPEEANQFDSQTRTQTGGTSASTIYTDIATDSTPAEGDLVNNWLNSPEGDLFLERQKLAGMNAEAIAESAKAELEGKYRSERETLENSLAAKGLAFSGIRATKVKALADSLAASTLEVDREFASKLLDANLDLREAILKGVADLAKKAEEGEKEAIKQLNLIGYAVINGELVPTLAAERERRVAESADVYVVTNEAGQVSGVSKSTGEVVWTTGGGVGRTGSATPTVTWTPIVDPMSGQPSVVQGVNRETGEVEYRDVSTGQIVDPSEVQIKEGQDSLDALIDSVIGDIDLSEL